MTDGKRKNTPLENLLKAISASGAEVRVVDLANGCGDPFSQYHAGVRIILPETYARITASGSTWSKTKQDLVTIMFHESGGTLFSSRLIGFSLGCNEDQYNRLKAAFPEECKLADAARSRELTEQLIDEVMHLNYTIILENEKRKIERRNAERGVQRPNTPGSQIYHDPSNN